MPTSIAVIYNRPQTNPLLNRNEQAAEEGVLTEVDAASKALQSLDYKVEIIPLELPLNRAFEQLAQIKADLIFNLFEGFGGYPETEYLIAQELESLKFCYTGAPSKALKLALNKASAKKLLHKECIRTPAFQLLDKENLKEFNLNFPCIAKPNYEDASHSINSSSVVENQILLEQRVIEISTVYNTKALVEEYIDGREFNITIMGNKLPIPLSISEICFTLPEGTPKILSYKAKWDIESIYYKGTQPQCPADLDTDTKELIIETAVRTYSVTGCRGYARVDMRMDKNGNIYVLEINPNPDISPDAGASLQAKASGMDYAAFINKIVQLATEKGLDY
jgi:D-alanine-D-alanine ligase